MKSEVNKKDYFYIPILAINYHTARVSIFLFLMIFLACDETHDLKKLSFPIVIFDGSIYKNVNCRAHIISSFLVVTGTLFSDATTTLIL